MAEGRMLYLSVLDEQYPQHVTVAEWEYIKELFRREAIKEKTRTGTDVVAYGDARFKDDNLTVETAAVYILPLSLEEFDERKTLLYPNEQVYVV